LLLAATVASLVACDDGRRAAPPDRRDLLRADTEFANAVSDAERSRRAAVWAEWFAPDGRQLVPGAVLEGRSAIEAAMEPVFADTAFQLVWEPDHAEIAADGDLGWTSGRYTMHASAPAGSVARRTGRYVTIWRWSGNEGWRVVLDAGVPDPGG
jgi:uncharacterized protein (TIGR02246 family)